MPESRVKIINRLGLHARAAAKLVKVAGGFQSDITVADDKNKNCVDAKSILNLLTLCASQGTELRVVTKGKDEKEALEDIKRIFREGFGEDN